MARGVLSTFAVLLGACLATASAATLTTRSTAQQTAGLGVNPIRKVVTMLQMMMKKVEAEGEKEKELFEKYMCYCKSSGGALAKSIADAEAKIPQVMSDIEAGEAEMKQLKLDIEQHKKDRADAKEAMAEATAVREKEAAAFAKENAESLANIDAIAKAIAALEKGMAGFLQTSAATVLRRLVLSTDVGPNQRDLLTSFLTEDAGTGYAPQSGEIVGILKQMKDTMEKEMQEAIDAEEQAKKIYEELMAAKTKEVEALTKAIEEKLARMAELGVEIVNMKEDLDDTSKALIEDKKFLADLDKNCALKEKEWAERSKIRAEELLALADTIKLLNDDDALELFKKTLPSASLLQLKVTSEEMRQRALRMLRRPGHGDARLDLLALSLRSRKVSFVKVIKMIDDMVALLAKEQADDEAQKLYCEEAIDKAEDDIKELEHAIGNLESSIADTKEAIATLTEEIKALIDGIAALDKAVAEATENRKEENEDFVENMAADTAALQILDIAKNRLNKFYNPKLYKAPPKRELTEEERITLNMGGTLAPTNAPGGIAGTGVAALAQEAPPPPPETWGAYQKKGEESGGVIAMIDLLRKDLKTEMTEMETEEKLAQEDYEKFMADSAEKRASDSKAIEDKEAAKAGLQADLVNMEADHKAKGAELMATTEALSNLHLECDWLLKNYDLRKEARAGEVESLKNAKAVLSGADYSLLQTATHERLSH